MGADISGMRPRLLTGAAAALALLICVPTAVANASAPETTGAPGPGVKAAQGAVAQAASEVIRLSGADRFETAVEISFASWDDWDAVSDPQYQAGAVILARSDTYADALAAAPLAAAKRAPLLLTTPGSLNTRTEAEIQRVLPTKGTVYVLGGAGAISGAVEKRLTGLGFVVKRLFGVDRYATAVAVAVEVEKTIGKPQFIALTTGTNFPDGLSMGAAAGTFGSTLVLTNGKSLPAATRAYLDAHPAVEVVAAGGQAAATGAATWDLVGKDRYETSAMIADAFFGDPAKEVDFPMVLGVATGTNWPDALAASAMLGDFGGPLVLTAPTGMPAASSGVIKYLENRRVGADIQVGYVYGGTSVVGTAVSNKLFTLITG